VTESRSARRDLALAVIAFAATLVLLGGGWVLLRQGVAGSGAHPSSASSGANATAGSSSSTTGPTPSSSSAASGGAVTDVVLTGAGDIGACGLSGAADTSDLLIDQPGTIFTAGDNAYENGSDREYASCYAPTWGRVKDRTMPAPGNHDYQTAHAAGYVKYFGTAAEPDGTTWYSKDLGAWHVIVLDSNCAAVGGCEARSPQGRWLATDLAANSDTRCTLAIWHHPRFSSGEHGNDVDVGPFWSQLVPAHADLIINGHDHDYERFAPQDASGREDRTTGIREIVVGTGGAGLRAFTHQAANSEFRLAGAWGVIRLTLRKTGYDWQFLPANGVVTDSGSAPCH
jgi:acid phosphatase type 7